MKPKLEMLKSKPEVKQSVFSIWRAGYLALAIALLAGCFQQGSGPVGNTPVAVTMTNSPLAGVGVTSASVDTLTLNVIDSAGNSLASATVSGTHGQTVTINLDVPAGPGRIFLVQALSPFGTVIFSGQSDSVDLSLGVPATISIPVYPYLYGFSHTVTAEFPIATTSGSEVSISSAFDGANYLVGIQGDQNFNLNVTAQLVSGQGTLIGPRISMPGTPTFNGCVSNRTVAFSGGGSPQVAFDGRNYLVIWSDGCQNPNFYIAGQFVNKSGGLIGVPFLINGGAGAQEINGWKNVIFDGTNYFVIWDSLSTPGTGASTDVYGQFVTPSGALLGSPIPISTAPFGQRFATALFDGTNIFVVWVDGRNQSACSQNSGGHNCFESDTYGQFLTKSNASTPGSLQGSNFAISTSSFPRDNPPNIVFDGTNYLVTWNQEVNIPTCSTPGCNPPPGIWHIYGQLVSRSGTNVGSVISLSNGLGDQHFPEAFFDSINYIVAWADGLGTNTLQTKIKARAFDTAGNPLGLEINVFSPTSDGRIPWLAPITPGLLNEGMFSTTGSMSTSRYYHFTANLLPNGKILVAGGENSTSSNPNDTASADQFDSATGTFTPTGSMSTPRNGHTATTLINGKVLIAGGDNTNGTSAELYDSTSGTFASTGLLNHCRLGHTATLLQNGKVLIAGGCGTGQVSGNPDPTSAELYDQSTGVFTPTGSMAQGRTYHFAVLLPSGKVLVAGGCIPSNCSTPTASAELYDPASGTWSVTGSMGTPRQDLSLTAILLSSGKILIAGGSSNNFVNVASAELYDPATGTWTSTGSMIVPRGQASSVLLFKGQVLVAGGNDASNSPVISAEIYDPVRGTWALTGSLAVPRATHTAILLPNLQILIAGGSDTSGNLLPSAELYSGRPTNPTTNVPSYFAVVNRGIPGVPFNPNTFTNQDVFGAFITSDLGTVSGTVTYTGTAGIPGPNKLVWVCIYPFNDTNMQGAPNGADIQCANSTSSPFNYSFYLPLRDYHIAAMFDANGDGSVNSGNTDPYQIFLPGNPTGTGTFGTSADRFVLNTGQNVNANISLGDAFKK